MSFNKYCRNYWNFDVYGVANTRKREKMNESEKSWDC